MESLQFQVNRVDSAQRQQWQERTRTRWTSTLSTPVVTVAVIAAAAVYSNNVQRIMAVMQEAKVDVVQAKQAIALAEYTNARGELVMKEVVDKATALKAASLVDAQAAATITGIVFTAVGGITSAQIDKPTGQVSIQYTVSGTDGYYDSKTRQTDARGTVSFAIPRARAGVRDSISVSVLLSGRTARTVFRW